MEQRFGRNRIDLEVLRDFCEQEGDAEKMELRSIIAEHVLRQRNQSYLDFHRATARERYELLLKRCPGIVQHLPLNAFAPDGRVWLALCTVSLSSHKEAGHIEFRQLGTPGKRIYSPEAHRWQPYADVALRPEEKQVLVLAAQGYTIQEIANRLCRGTDTVKHYRRQIFQKLAAQSITEALAYATNYGLL